MSLPVIFSQRLHEFFMSLPDIHDSSSWKALLFSAALDDALLNQIHFTGPVSQFPPTLITTLIKYGTLIDGRDALEAVLTAAKEKGGLEIQAEGLRLIQEWQALRLQMPGRESSPLKPEAIQHQKQNASIESLDTLIIRVLSGYYQQHPGDPEMSIEELLQTLPDQQPQIIQNELFSSKSKGWINYELTTSGIAGLVWIEPKGIKIAKQFNH